MKIDRHYVDLITGEKLDIRNEVMERLTQNAYVVQIIRLGEQQRNDVEELPAVFRQDHPADEAGHTLIVDEGKAYTPLVNDILRNLRHLVEEPGVKHQMTVEDEMYEAYQRAIEEERRKFRKAIREVERQREEAERGREEERRFREEEQRKREEEQRKRENSECKYMEAQAEIERLRRLSQ